VKVLDLTNEECPIPFMRAMAQLTKLKAGEEMTVITTDQKCYDMLLEGAKTLEQQVLEAKKEDGKYYVAIRKVEARGRKLTSTC